MIEFKSEWKNIGEVPSQKGFEKNCGTAGMLSGVLDGKIIFGGGANFPYIPLIKGGEKVFHKDIYLVDADENGFKILDQIQIDFGFGYGSTVSSEDALYYIGGTNTDGLNHILKVTVENNKLSSKIIGDFDFDFENCIAEYIDGNIFFGIGSINGCNSNRFFKYNLESGKLYELAPFPGNPRNQAVSSSFGKSIAVFGGADNVAYFDGWLYSLEDNEWKEIAPVEIHGESISLLGAASSKINDDEMIVTGGFNKDVWKDACFKFATLEDEEKQLFRKKYFTQEPELFRWNEKVLVYNIKDNAWYYAGDLNFLPPCGHALLNTGSTVFSVMGEIKPGTRSPNIYAAILK